MKPIVAFVLAGIIGGAGGLLFALGALRPEPFPDSYHPITVAVPFVIAAASVAAGVLAAWFLTLLIMSWAPGRFRCPRCGVANTPGGQSCHGCLLPFV
ncbi:MAG TPA: hypothetical protein VGL16_09485 [Actinomycetota bacterium]|jgi:hypothetical protein